MISPQIVMWQFFRNRRLILHLHTIFTALICRAHRAVVPAIACHLAFSCAVSDLILVILLLCSVNYTWVHCDFQDIAGAWKMLENAEKGYEEWLLSEMQRYVFSVSFLVYFASALDKCH